MDWASSCLHILHVLGVGLLPINFFLFSDLKNGRWKETYRKCKYYIRDEGFF